MRAKVPRSCTLGDVANPAVFLLDAFAFPECVLRSEDERKTVGTWLSLVERTLGVGEVASSNLVVPTIFSFNQLASENRFPICHLPGRVAVQGNGHFGIFSLSVHAFRREP